MTLTDAQTENIILRRFSAFIDLTGGETAALKALHEPPEQRDTSERITIEGDEPSRLFLLREGWVLSSVVVADGGRQVIKVHRQGDIMGAPSLPFTTSVESLTALTPSKVSVIPLSRVGALFTAWPRLGAVLFLIAQEERAASMARLVARGRLDARQNFVELLLAVHKAGLDANSGSRVYLPMTQAQIGDVLGLSAVHVNRVVRDLQLDGFIHREKYIYHLLDVARLEAFVGLPERARNRNPSWLPAPR